MKKLLIYELNELPLSVLNWYMAINKKGFFAKRLSSENIYETICSDEGELHPWTTWPTLYRGVNNSKHKISDYLLKKASEFLNCELSNYDYKAIHFWRYAMLENINNFGSFVDENSKIIVCGDWCMNGKVEGAFLSANDAVKKILKYI